MAKKQISVLPGFRLTLGYTLLYLSLIVIIPLAATFVKSSELSWAEFSHTVFSPQALAAYRLSFGASFFAAAVNAVFGLIVACIAVSMFMPMIALIQKMSGSGPKWVL